MDELGKVALFGSGPRTTTLLIIALLGETHAGEIARIVGRSRSRIKAAVDSLEREGVIVGVDEGKTRRLSLNPRYVAADELRALVIKLGTQDFELQKLLATVRRRPRRAGKAI